MKRLVRPFIYLVFAFILNTLFIAESQGQSHVQRVRGSVVDLETHQPIFGVIIRVYIDTVMFSGTATNELGVFEIESVPSGKINVFVTALGYKSMRLENLDHRSAKETVLNLELEGSMLELNEITIKATNGGEVLNEMATVSSKQFSISETERYAGSRGDPARMASNFAGVQGADDSRNDIVIRGNSPQSVLWRIEGIDIPNPNHFNIPGTAGGPVSVINNKYLANSDFFTGAFPADYGNSVAGVFDLRLRNGNNQKHELSGQFGFLGTELFAEGPINKKTGSSYLASYRYSTLQLFSALGIDIGTDAVPRYQDGAFRVFLPTKNNTSIAIWGIGGSSAVDILISKQTSPDQRNIYGENDRDQYFKTKMGVVGTTLSKTIGEKSFLKATVALTSEQVNSHHELVFRHTNAENIYVVDSMKTLLNYTFKQSKISSSIFLNHKFSNRLTWRSGMNADLLFWNDIDSVRVIDTTQADYYQWRKRWNSTQKGALIQPYTQIKYRVGESLSLTLGLHALYFSLTNSLSFIEPRLGLKYDLGKRHRFSLGLGRHSQIQPTYMYFYQPGYGVNRDTQINRNMGLTKSDHAVLGYELTITKFFRLKTEVYYQRLFNIPVEKQSSSFSLVNTGAGFSRFFPGELVNTGTARNFGWELTLERSLQKGYLFLFTASVFDSKYKGSDGVLRNTDFNGKYATNILASKEWKTSENGSLTLGIKATTAGGRWYGPADIEKSNNARDLVYVDSLRNTLQFKPYFRMDIKVKYRVNRAKVTHEVGVDLVNILNTKNVLSLTYAPDLTGDPSKSIRQEYQLGFLPLFYYRLDF